MNSRQTITFFTIILVAILAAFIVWPRVAMTQQDEAPQKKQQTPTIDEYQPKSTLVTKEHKIEIFTAIIGIPHRKKWTGLSKKWMRSTCASW